MDSNQAWLDRLKKNECADSTYEPQTHPLVFDKALGSFVWDVAGRRYVDLCAGFGALTLGHHPDVLRPIWQQLASSPTPDILHGMGDVYSSQAKIELIEHLLAALPDTYQRVSLALSGSQAVETALKTAMLATKKSGFISFSGGYHGVDFGALHVTAREDFKNPFGDLLHPEKIAFVDYASEESQLKNHLNAAKQQLDLLGGVAAVIVEPVQGRVGGRSRSISWFKTLKEFCQQAGILLIYDEVFCGLGRTGRMSFSEEIPADLMCFGKSLGGGLPLSACVGTAAAMSDWPESKGEAIHTGTFFGHPLACQLGVQILKEIKHQNLASRANQLGAAGAAHLQKLIQVPVELRQFGLMIVVEGASDLCGAAWMDQLRAAGIIALACGEQGRGLSLTPALNISETEFFEALHTVAAVINQEL